MLEIVIRCLVLFRFSGYQNMQSHGRRSYDPKGSFMIGLVNVIFGLGIVDATTSMSHTRNPNQRILLTSQQSENRTQKYLG